MSTEVEKAAGTDVSFTIPNTDSLGKLKELVPTVRTKQACKLLNCSRQWLSKNRNLFGGKVINRRGDMEFETIKIMKYKNR